MCGEVTIPTQISADHTSILECSTKCSIDSDIGDLSSKAFTYTRPKRITQIIYHAHTQLGNEKKKLY